MFGRRAPGRTRPSTGRDARGTGLEVWTSVAHPWALAADIKCFEENPIDVPTLVAEWRERHG